MNVNIRLRLITLALAVTLLCLCCFGVATTAFAAKVEYTDVLTDLMEDESFNISDYPNSYNDYSIHVITVAESANKELFVYVYQPCNDKKDLSATSIRIGRSVNGGEYRDYKLELVSTENVFDKYIVKSLTVYSAAVRYYDVVAIFRSWDKDIDDGAYNDNKVTEVPYEVGKLYTVSTENDEVIYRCDNSETITVTAKYVGYLRYPNGTRADLGYLQWDKLQSGYTDSWYVAFSTDKPIEKLYDADVTYISQSHEIVQVSSGVFGIGARVEEHYGEPETIGPKTLRSLETASVTADGWGGRNYTWHRIEKTAEFVENENLTTAVESEVEKKDWVLRFAETSVVVDHNNANNTYDTKVSEVTILRLYFRTAGNVYNLGVVDNKQSPNPTGKPGNVDWSMFSGSNDGIPWWVIALVVLGIVILLCIFVRPILTVVLWALKALWYIVSSPVRLIVYLVRKKRGDE